MFLLASTSSQTCGSNCYLIECVLVLLNANHEGCHIQCWVLECVEVYLHSPCVPPKCSVQTHGQRHIFRNEKKRYYLFDWGRRTGICTAISFFKKYYVIMDIFLHFIFKVLHLAPEIPQRIIHMTVSITCDTDFIEYEDTCYTCTLISPILSFHIYSRY